MTRSLFLSCALNSRSLMSSFLLYSLLLALFLLPVCSFILSSPHPSFSSTFYFPSLSPQSFLTLTISSLPSFLPSFLASLSFLSLFPTSLLPPSLYPSLSTTLTHAPHSRPSLLPLPLSLLSLPHPFSLSLRLWGRLWGRFTPLDRQVLAWSIHPDAGRDVFV